MSDFDACMATIYDAGFAAYEAGSLMRDCPYCYRFGTPWRMWVDGWLDAKRAADLTKKLPVGGDF